ncbi:MMPL family transporter [Desulfococcaceae bacterium HSG9]|nr:MMPL family transporter [Desulfococcaceae bacterium HSG9]
MQKLMFWSYKHPKLVLVILLGVTLFFSFFIPKIPVDVSVQMFWSKGDPAKQLYDDTVATFGSDKITVVYIKDSHIFTPEMLARLSDFHFALDGLPDVIRVDSLFSIANLKGEDGFLNIEPFFENIPETIAAAETIKADALKNPIAVNNIVASDGSAITFNVFLDEGVSPDDETQFSTQVDEVIATIASHVEQVFQLGTPYSTRMCYEGLVHDQRTVVPLAFLLFSLTSLVIWRSFSLLSLTIITSGLSVIWTLGFMGLFNIPMNLFTAIIPALLIVVGSTEDMHLFSEYQAGLRETGTRTGAVPYMIQRSGLALMLTALTTFLGFLAISLNKILILKQFGITCAFGLMVNPLVTFLAAPVFLRFFGPRSVVDSTSRASEFVNALFTGLARKITILNRAYKWQAFGIFTGTILIVGIFTFQIKIDNDLVGVFKPSSPLRVSSKQLHEELAGAQTFLIHIKSENANAFNQPENLAQIAAIQAFLRQSSWCDLTVSIVDYLKLTSREMHDGDKAFNKIPDSSDLSAQYLLILPADEITSLITDDASEVNIIVRHNVSSSHGLKEIVAQITDFIEGNLNPRFECRITGESIISLTAADTLVTGQVTSLSFTLVVVFLLMYVLFTNVKAGVLSLATNMLPIILYCGLMGVLGIFLNTGTSMVAVIAIGIAVDDTVHFMTRYSKEMRRLQNQDKAIEACIHHLIRPTMATSIGLALGFSAIMLSDLLPLIHFGFLAALTILVALMADLIITPILLASTQLLTLWDMLTLELQQAVISESPLFKNLKRWQIKKVVLLGKIMCAGKGDALIRQGDQGQSMYLLLEGRVRVEVGDGPADVSKQVLYHFNPGEVFGEIALVNPGPRTADIIATEDVSYLEFDWDGIERIFRVFPPIAARLYRNLALILGQRLRETTKKMLV